ncbi:MAG: ABC transporter permease [Myxococcaceae bacterium]
MTVSPSRAALAAGVLGLVHLGMGLLPAPPFSAPMNLVLYATNLYVLYCAASVLKRRSGGALALFVAGYLALLGLTLGLMGKRPLFILLVIVYASVFGSPVLLGAFGLFVLCFVVLQPYAFESFIPLVLIYAVAVRARRSASPFVLWCLVGGMVALVAVLFPLIHLGMQDSPQTLWRALSRPDVQGALWTSLATSTIATVVVAVWGIPLAYALARLEFPGKRLVESLIDVPILVPQSVAGVALIVLLGPSAPLGQGLESFGFRVSGTWLGLVLAQVFVASPFLVKSAMTAFEGVPRQLELASRSLGATAPKTFLKVSLPLAARGILVGGVLAWARAVSEFGTVILFASSPLTAPVLVHTEFLRAGTSESRPIAVLLLITCVWIFVMLQFGQTLLPFALRRRP